MVLIDGFYEQAIREGWLMELKRWEDITSDAIDKRANWVNQTLPFALHVAHFMI